MTSKPLEVRVLITELPTQVEKKSKQTDLNDTPKPMSLPINDLPKELHKMTKNDYMTKMETKKKKHSATP